MTKRDLLNLMRPHGQEHLLAFWHKLDPGQRESLVRQIQSIDFDLTGRLYDARGNQADMRQLADRAQPPPAFRLDHAGNAFSPQEASQRGAEALRAGELGAILVAGGQGTRLGFEQPKGMFSIGPLSHKSLFQILIEKLLAAARRHGVRIPLYLMTSPATHDETVAYFSANKYFGLPEDDVFFFCQGTMPAVDSQTGHLLLEGPGQLALSPDGHGGMLAALAGSGGLQDIERRGIRQLFYFQVDNTLVDVCGPEFIGYHLLSDSEFSTQVIAKRYPLERLGNVVQVHGRPMVIEYSDLPEEAARRCNPDGSLAIWAGSIAVHVIDAALLRRTAGSADGLPFHLAYKKVPYIDEAGKLVQPDKPNAVKFERFIFDLMPLARRAIVVEVDPEKAFAPLKNAAGAPTDSPETVRRQMSALHRDWLRRAGAEIDDATAVEISPLFALGPADLAQKIPPHTRISEPTYFG
jgi:UDP-N-acetylglucosamine/UDP-N-acetylgalactosamine diphosphorylase